MNSSSRIHIPSLLLLATNGLALVTILPVVLFMLIILLTRAMSGPTDGLNLVMLLSFAWIGIFLGLLTLPGIVLSLFRLFGKPLPQLVQGNPLRLASIALAFWPLIILGGWVSSTRGVLTWLVLPPLQVLAVALPLWYFIELGRHKVAQGSAQRGWGVLSLGIALGPTLAGVIEIIGLILVLIGVGIWVSTQPEQMRQLEQLMQQLQRLDVQSPRAMELLQPYLTRPGVVAGMLAVTSVFIPLIEEAVKALPVLVLALWRKVPPAEGFTAGLVAGGAFGLIESLGTTLNLQSTDWALVLTLRVGTGLLHVVTTSLVGWGIASALHDRRWLRLLLSYLAAVSLHGLWNAGAMITAGYEMSLGAEYAAIILAAGILMALVAVALFAVLISLNRRLRRTDSILLTPPN